MTQASIAQAVQISLQMFGAGKLGEAQMVCQRILQQQPDHVDALHLLGVIARQAGRSDVSIELIQRAILLKPDWPEANINLAAALQDCGRVDEAIACCRLAVAGTPSDAAAHNNLAAALQKNGLLDEAIESYLHAIKLNALVPTFHCNLGTVLEEKGNVAEAMAAYRQAIVLKPDYAEAHNNHSMLSILLGDFVEGWKEYEWRFRCKDYPRPRWNVSVPRWDGSQLQGRTIFLHAEQGFGDAIQFVRYVKLVAARGGKIVLGCARELQRLFECVLNIERLVTWGDDLPAVDVHCPLMSLPMMFANDLNTIPDELPYLSVDLGNTNRWRNLVSSNDQLKVGLAWAGGIRPWGRSIAVEDLTALIGVPDVQFFSLQKGNAWKPAGSLPFIDHMDLISDFADTAALISQLDLVITIDTAVAHLAGAMGKRVWTLLKFMPDCRWMLEREDSPWYPTMRLFRQPTIGNWGAVIEQVVRELAKEPRTK